MSATGRNFLWGEGVKRGLGMLFTDRRDKIFIKQSEATRVPRGCPSRHGETQEVIIPSDWR